MAGKTVTFESKFSHYEIVRQHRIQVPSPTGIGYMTTQKGLTYTFQPTPSNKAENGWIGVLTVREGQDQLVDSEDFLKLDEDVEAKRDAVQALMANRAFGQDFWIAGHEPGTQYPRPQDLRRDIKVWVATLNEDELVGALRKERGSHERAELLEELEDSIDIVRQLLAQQAEQSKPAAKSKAAA